MTDATKREETAQEYRLFEPPKLFGHWISPSGMYEMCWYEKPTLVMKFAAWMMGWKWRGKA